MELHGKAITLVYARCGGRHVKTVGWIRDNTSILCGCGAATDFAGDPLVQAAIAAAADADLQFAKLGARAKPIAFGRRR